jgi:hypothetical protein
MRVLTYALSLLCLIASAWAADTTNPATANADDYLRVIRANDLNALKAL